MFFLLGASGSGKSTLLRVISGLEEPEGGLIFIDQKCVNDVPTEKRKIGFVFQSYALWPHLNIADHVKFGLKYQTLNAQEKERRFDNVVDLCQLSSLLDRYPHQLSGGQQQRVALARGLVLEPQVLLLDEPLANLDPALRSSVLDEIVNLKQRLGITIIYVTHNKDEALKSAERIAFLSRGTLVQIGTPKELYQMPKTREVAEFFDEMIYLDATDLLIGANTPFTTLAFRPHQIIFKTRSEINPNDIQINGTIKDIKFLGSHVEVRLQLTSGKTIKVPSSLEDISPEDNIPTIMASKAIPV